MDSKKKVNWLVNQYALALLEDDGGIEKPNLSASDLRGFLRRRMCNDTGLLEDILDKGLNSTVYPSSRAWHDRLNKAIDYCTNGDQINGQSDGLQSVINNILADAWEKNPSMRDQDISATEYWDILFDEQIGLKMRNIFLRMMAGGNDIITDYIIEMGLDSTYYPDPDYDEAWNKAAAEVVRNFVKYRKYRK